MHVLRETLTTLHGYDVSDSEWDRRCIWIEMAENNIDFLKIAFQITWDSKRFCSDRNRAQWVPLHSYRPQRKHKLVMYCIWMSMQSRSFVPYIRRTICWQMKHLYLCKSLSVPIFTRTLICTYEDGNRGPGRMEHLMKEALWKHWFAFRPTTLNPPSPPRRTPR